MKMSLNALMIFLLGFWALGATLLPETEREMEQTVHRNINDYRRRQGLEELKFSDTVAGVAREHSAAMASGKTAFGHDGFDKRNKTLSKLISKRSLAENVAKARSTENDVVDLIHNGWLHSEGHHANIVGDFDMTGVGVATAKDGTIHFTQIFLKTVSE